MDILKRSVAPITQNAWDKIDEEARDVILSKISARKVVHVKGPYGWDYTVVNEGRLEDLTCQEDDICTGRYIVQPLIEARVSFRLSKWELDNVERGAEDIEFDELDNAIDKLIRFEDGLIFNGNKAAGVKGLVKEAKHKVEFGTEVNEILVSIAEGMNALEDAYAKGRYDLVVSREFYNRLVKFYDGKQLLPTVGKLIGGKVVKSHVLEGGLLLPQKDEDLEMTIGQDFSIGYEGENEDKVNLFVTESITFRVLDEYKIVRFE